LRESEASYRVLFSGASDGILVADARSKRFRFANPAICRMMGYTEEEFLQLSVADIHPMESLDHVLAEFEALARGETRSSPDLPCRRKDGTIFYADISHSTMVLAGQEYHAGFFHDITARKQAEEAVFQSKKDWEDCFDSITDMITIHDNDYNIVRANKAGQELLQLPALEKHHPLKCFSFYHGTDAPPAGCPSCDCLKSGRPGVFEMFEPHLDRHLEIRALPRFDSNGRQAGLIHIVRDITERKKAEKVLRESEQWNKLILSTILSGVLVIEVATRKIVEANDMALKLIGLPKAQVVGSVCHQFICSADRENCPILDLGKEVDFSEKILLTADGKRTDIIKTVVPVQMDGRKYLIESFVNITEHKRVESQKEAALAALRKSEQRLSDIIASMGDWVWEVDENGVYTYSSEKGSGFLGSSRGDIIGKTPFDFMPADEANRVGALFAEIVAKKLPIKDLENWNVGKNGERICLLTSGVPILDERGNLKGYRGVDKDITGRKRAEEALQDAQIRYHLLFEHSPDGIVVIDPGTSRILEFNETAHKQLGYSREEFSRLSIPDIDTDETPEEIHSHIARVMAEGLNTFETRQRTRQGEIRNVLVTAQFTRIGGRPLYHCIWRDITDLKRAEKETEQIISLQRATIESTADGILAIDHEGKITDFNQRFASMWRIPDSVLAARDDAQALGFVLDQLFDPQEFLAKVNELYAAPDQESFDLLQLKDGRFFERYSRPQQISGQPPGRVWSFRDISERRQAQEALRQSEERFRTLYENTTLGLYRTTPDGRIHLANPALVQMLGYSSFADLANKNLEESNFDPSFTRAQFIKDIEKDGEVKGLEYAWKRNDGGTIIVRESARAIRNTQGKTLYYDGIVENITERKQSKRLTEALYGISQASYLSVTLNELYQRIHGLISNVVSTDNLFIALLSDDGKALTFPYFIDEKDTGDRSAIEVDNSQSLTVEVLKTKKPLLLDETELLDRYATGKSKVWVAAPKCWLGVPLMIRETVIGVMVVQDYHQGGAYSQKDVTLLESAAGQIAIAIDRKRAEEEIKTQLLEKEILLREVHHRIKNNIASISGLLSLRLQTIGNPAAVPVLQDAISRVDSMRILYDKLLLSKGYETISVKNYVDSLTDGIVALFPGDAKVTVDKQIADFHLDAKRLFPLGLIINELITNKMKYAFTGRDAGKIKISLTKDDKHVKFAIQDDGNGLPSGFDIEQSKGFGLTLVKMLCQQLAGTFSMENNAGVSCQIEFPI
jgi:PAS domain S-box-containing protein